MLPPDRDRADADLMQRLVLNKPRRLPFPLRLLRRFWRWC